MTQELDGEWRRLRGNVRLELPELTFEASEIDYNEKTGETEARGNVHYKNYQTGEEIWASKVEYNTESERGKFYDVRGYSTAKIEARPGVLATSSPFYFEGKWAERLGTKYILHYGTVTNCKVPNPTWTLKGPTFDIVPNERAIARNAIFRVRKIPLFYTPFFYKSLEKLPRRSGFLQPNFGNSNRRGFMFGVGYYWAINRSYDVTYRIQNFTQRGLAHHFDWRGKPREGTDFNAIFYGVDDKGLEQPNGERVKQGGFSIYTQVKSDIGKGWYGRATVNYLSSLQFRQAFTESFQEAIFSEVHSTGFVGRQWSSFSFNIAAARLENFQSAVEKDRILVRKLPELSFISRERRVTKKGLPPIWVSFESTAGLLHRSELNPAGPDGVRTKFQTGEHIERLDFQPRVMTAIRWKSVHVLPYVGLRTTHWGESLSSNQLIGENRSRNTMDVGAEVVLPALERTFRRKTFLGDQVKHVIEPRASFRHVSGVADFDRFIRFDSTELMTNTTEAEISVTQRLIAKRNGGDANEILSWTVWQRRYFDPSLGGAILDGQRNQVLSSAELTPYAFFDRARNYSPVVSALRATPTPGVGIEWRTDYDPLREQVVNSSFTADARFGSYFVSAGHSQVRSAPVLTPNANQFRGALGFGNPNRRGWNAGFTSVYDYRLGVMQFATTQVTYNTDCCGLSVQYRRFGFGTRNENQWRVAFAVANLGSFGTLRKQERLF